MAPRASKTSKDLSRDGRLALERAARFLLLLRVAGFDDPMEYYGSNPDDPHRIFSFAQLPDQDRALADAQHRLLAWFNSLPQRPDVVEVHENGLVVLSPDWALSHTDCSSAVDYLDPREGPKTNAIHGARPISPLAPIAGARVP